MFILYFYKLNKRTMTNSTKSQGAESDNVSSTKISLRSSQKATKFQDFSSDEKNQNSSRPLNRKKKNRRGRKSQQPSFKFNSSLTETADTRIYAISFNIFEERQIFATASGNRISIYECLDADEAEHSIKLIRVYNDPGMSFCYLCWKNLKFSFNI